MATTPAKGGAKPAVETKKDPSPAKQNQAEVKDAKTEQKDNKSQNDQQQRNNRNDSRERFFNRRGGRGGNNRGGHNRGNFHNRERDQGGNNNSNNQNNNQGFHKHVQQGEFSGEQNDGPKEQKKFTGRCRLFVGNITPDTTEEQFKEMFSPYGEVSEVFVNAARGFGFIRLDYRLNAERAKVELDGQMRNNRVLRVRFATHGAALKVFNLSPFVSNELLEKAFAQFGDVERAIVTVDDRGRSCGEGIVEFSRKPAAMAAQKRISEGVFFLSAYPRPVRVEPLDQKDEEDGLTEKFVQRNDGFRKDREKEPRFPPPGSFEFEFGLKYRRIDDMEREQIERVKQEMDLERQRLADEMETAVFDFQAEQIRQDLLRQQEELKRLDEMKNEHMRRRQEMDIRRADQMRGSTDNLMRQEEERRREIMMRASNTMNREQGGGNGGIGGQGPNQSRGGGRPDDMMMRGPGNSNMRESPQRGGNPRNSGCPGTPPMPPPPVPPGMNMDQPNRPGPNMDGDRFGGMPGNNLPGRSPGDSPIMDRNMPDQRGPPGMGNMGNMGKPDMMPRPGPQGQQGRFQGPPGPGNFPPMGNMGGGPGGNMYPPKMPGGMGGNQNMGADRRRESSSRRDDFEMKRMRRF